MAKLPNYTEIAGGMPVPKEVGGGIANINVPGGMDAEGVATMSMGKTIMGIGEEFAREQEKIDTIKVEDAWNKYKTAALDLSIGKDGILTTQGDQAVNGKLLERADTTLTATRQDIMTGLGSSEQQRRFAQRADITDLQTKHQVLQHLVGQTKEYEKMVFQGSEAAAKSQITSAPTDPGVFEGARQTLMGQADGFLKSNGISGDAAKAFKDKLMDGLWTTRVDALLYTQPLLADSMLRANVQNINSPETRLLLQARTREASMPVRAANDADVLIQQVRDIPRNATVTLKGMTREGALQMVNAALVTNPTDYDTLEAKYVLEATGEQTTSGLPNSRDIAAQLPLVLARVEKKANEVYGPDKNSPDRMAYVKRLTTEIHSRIASDVQQLNAVQREAQGTLIDAVMGLGGKGGMMTVGSGGGGPGKDMGGAKITSFSQLQSNPDLMRAYQRADPVVKASIDRMIERNNAPDKEGDTTLFREMFNRIHQDPNTPGKIDFYQQIIDPSVADRLSIQQIGVLRRELDLSETPGGRSLNQMRKTADQKVEQYFRTNVMFTAQPERQIAATMAWNEEVGKKIDAAAKLPNGGEAVRKMFMLDTPESVISPNYLNTFVNSTPARGVAQGAAAVRDGAPPIAAQPPVKAPATLKTPEEVTAWIATLPAGTTQFMDPTGKVRQIPPRAAPAIGVPATRADLKDIVEPNPDFSGPESKRPDGSTKGMGFLGPLKVPGTGGAATEYSVGVKINGKEMDIPTLVPTLTRPEIDQVLQAAARGGDVPEPIVKKAAEFAKQRIAAGKSVFAGPEDINQTPYPVMSLTGKVVQPDAPAAELKMPTLVLAQTKDERLAARTAAGEAQAKKDAETLARSTRGAAEGVRSIPTAMAETRANLAEPGERAVKGAVSAVVQALTPDDAARAVSTFRTFIQSGRYTPASEPVILDAMESGLLTGQEAKAAAQMLRAISAAKGK